MKQLLCTTSKSKFQNQGIVFFCIGPLSCFILSLRLLYIFLNTFLELIWICYISKLGTSCWEPFQENSIFASTLETKYTWLIILNNHTYKIICSIRSHWRFLTLIEASPVRHLSEQPNGFTWALNCSMAVFSLVSPKSANQSSDSISEYKCIVDNRQIKVI